MSLRDSLALPDPKRPLQRPAPPVDVAGPVVADALRSRFACPVCAHPLHLTRGTSISVSACPVCHSRVVAPQPQFGCRAMVYRDWLKLQEIDPLDLAPPPPPALPRPSALPKPASRQRQSTSTPAPRPLPRSLRNRQAWGVGALGIALAAGLWHSLPPSLSQNADLPGPGITQSRSTRPAPDRSTASPPAPAARTGRGTGEPGDSTVVSTPAASPTRLPTNRPPDLPGRPDGEGITAPPGRSTFAAVLARSADSPTTVVALATRRHDFSRSAPQPDTALCLKLTDPADESVTTRAYIAITDPLAGPIQELLPWGQQAQARVGLQWQPHDPATHIDGHWRITRFEVATASQSMASATPR